MEILKTQRAGASRHWFARHAAQIGHGTYFDHEQDGYQRFRHQAIAYFAERELAPETVPVLVDVGCGTGVLTDLLRVRLSAQTAIGLDFTEEAISRGRDKYPKVDFRNSTLPTIPLPPSSVDMLLASEVVYYLTPDGQSEFFANARRVLRPGGVILIASALGDEYLSEGEISKHLSTGFSEVRKRHLRMRSYHMVVWPFRRALDLHRLQHMGTVPNSTEKQQLFRNLEPVIDLALVRIAVKLMSRVGMPILRSSSLPQMFDRFLGIGSPTNVFISARKRADVGE